MTHTGFLWWLGSLTALFGAILVGMLVARWREGRRKDAPRQHAGGMAAGVVPAPMADSVAPRSSEEPASERAAADVERELRDDGPPAAICPTCGVRYPGTRFTCARDASPLARLH